MDTGTWGDAHQLAQVEVAQVRVELFPSSHLVDGALPPALHGVVELALGLVHAWLVLLVSCAGWRSGALRRLDRLLTSKRRCIKASFKIHSLAVLGAWGPACVPGFAKKEMHQSIVQYTLTCCSEHLGAACVPRDAPPGRV